MATIDSFSGEYRYLSNFFPSTIPLGEYRCQTVEHAYQASKTTSPRERRDILNAPTPGAAKRLGRRCALRKDWETVKVDVMRQCLLLKFADPVLRARLLSTGDAELVEGNKWGDRYWGQSPVGVGENMLGRLLMQVRAELRGAAGPTRSAVLLATKYDISPYWHQELPGIMDRFVRSFPGPVIVGGKYEGFDGRRTIGHIVSVQRRDEDLWGEIVWIGAPPADRFYIRVNWCSGGQGAGSPVAATLTSAFIDNYPHATEWRELDDDDDSFDGDASYDVM